MEIARIIEEKPKEEENLIEIRMMEEMVLKKKESERMPTRMPWDHAIDLREGESAEVFEESVEKEIYSNIEITTDITGSLCTKER